MSTWRQHFTFNKYSQIAARALRAGLKEDKRVVAEKRGTTLLRYQKWENGEGQQQVYLNPPAETPDKTKSAAV